MDCSVCCNLSTLMGAKRMTIQDIHNITGLSRNTISNLYYDRATRVDYETLAKLCACLECEVGELLEVSRKQSNREG